MYYVIEKVSLGGDYNKCKKTISDYFNENLIDISNGKLRNYPIF